MGEVKYIKQNINVGSVGSLSSISDEHTSHLELQLGDKKMEFCTKTLQLNVGGGSGVRARTRSSSS